MKLIVTIVDDRDVDEVMAALTRQHIGVTRVSSTGGLISPGSSTLLIGLDEAHVADVTRLIAEAAALRQAFVPYSVSHAGSAPLTSFIEVQVGGFTTFVLNVDHFEQV